jgi:hypothetical protein
MRVVIKRVAAASVSTAERGIIGAVNKGLCVLVGFTAGDGDKEIDWATHHLLNGKYWPNEDGSQWKQSVQDLGYQVLLVSQFTLYGQVKSRRSLFLLLGNVRMYWPGVQENQAGLPQRDGRHRSESLIRKAFGICNSCCRSGSLPGR